MFDTKAMRFPSGEKLGDVQDPILAIRATVRLRSSLPAVCAITFWEIDKVVRLEENKNVAHRNARNCRRFLRIRLDLVIESGLFSFLASIDEMLFSFGTRHIN